MRKKTTEEFIADARVVHGDRYDYSDVIYVGDKVSVDIICTKHGKFPQRPGNHLQGKGCNTCSIEYRTRDTCKFIVDAENIHGYKYLYSRVKYLNNYTKVIVTCKDHGDFEQLPRNHLSGQGCKVCQDDIMTKNTLQFVRDAVTVHGSRYDYTKSKYVGALSELIITCKDHGDFPQKANNHLRGQGCPKCAKTGFNPSKNSTVYVYAFDKYVGFGITNVFKNRNKTHSRNFRKANLDFELVTTYSVTNEDVALWYEGRYVPFVVCPVCKDKIPKY